MEGTFLFFVVTILAIILAIYFEYTTSRATRKGGSDQRNSSDESVLSDFGSEHHGTGHPHGDAVDDEELSQGNWLISQITNSKVAAIFSETILCRIGMHQGTWTTESRQQRRFCIYCGIPQQKVTGNVFAKLRCLVEMHYGTWKTIDEFGCQQRRFCIFCGEPQYREQHKWSGPDYPLENIPNIGYVKCWNCRKIKEVDRRNDIEFPDC
jgi:hypothetical protein